ncbi:MAG: PAS domain S-box protein [Anaerolineales bacterium]|nr:PAS domain S-box protein [Anaerolineales bacterium]
MTQHIAGMNVGKKNNARILVVEDQILIGKEIQNTLIDLGYSVPLIASSGIEAIEKTKSLKPDLVVMDIVLNGEMDGVSAAKVIQKEFNIPVVYLTGYTDDETLHQAQISEPFGYVVKPFNTQELHTNIQVAIYRHRIQKELIDREEALRKKNASLELLNRIGQTLTSTLDFQQVIERMLEAAVEVVEANGSSVWLNDRKDKNTLMCQALYHDNQYHPLTGLRLQAGEGIAGWVVENRKHAIVNNVSEDLRFYPGVDQLTGFTTKSILAVPIIMRDEILGVLEVVNKFVGDFSDQDLVLLETVAASAAIAIDNAHLFEKTEQLKMFNENIVQSVAEAIFIIDTEEKISFANTAARELLGYYKNELIGKPVSKIAALHNQENSNNGWAPLSKDKDRFETSLKAQDGHIIPCIASTRPLLRDGQFVGVLAALTDITDRVQSEEELEKLVTDLDAFAHTAAHDLKVPLTLIIGYADILQKECETWQDFEHKSYIDALIRSSLKMENIIDELLLLSSLRMNQNVPIELLDMENIITEVLHRLAYMIEQHGAKVSLPDNWPTALGYSPWIEEVWANYMSNAIRYGGNPPQVEIGATKIDSGARIRYWVQDNGQGLSKQEQEQLFQPFSRLNHVRARGHGLGLSIVQRIMEKLRGEVDIESEIGVGSRFSFILPTIKAG